MLSDPVTKTGFVSAGLAPQAATLLSYAVTCRSGPAKPSVDVFGQVRSQCGLRIEEVSLERTRFPGNVAATSTTPSAFCFSGHLVLFGPPLSRPKKRGPRINFFVSSYNGCTPLDIVFLWRGTQSLQYRLHTANFAAAWAELGTV